MEEQQQEAMQPQSSSIQQRGETSPAVSLVPMTITEKAKYAAIAGVPSLFLLEALHAQGPGIAIAGFIGYSAWHFSDRIRDMLPERSSQRQQKSSQPVSKQVQSALYWLGTGHAMPTAPEQNNQDEEASDESYHEQDVSRHEPVVNALEWDESWYNEEEEESIVGPGIGGKGKFTFSDVLASDFVPSLSAICLARLDDGTLLTVAAKDLCHVALPGATGHGKSSLIRLIMAQLCYCGLPVYLLNPHYMVFDREHNEDWTPFTPYLKADPFACKDMPNIKTVLDWMVGKLLPQRKERTAKGGKVGKPYFFILDEVPDIVKAIPGASKMIGKLLREGRKYGIYLIVASQDFSVKTLDVEGEGGVRKCFHTILYVGGDPVSVRELLNAKGGKVGDLVIDENALGKGPIIARHMVRDMKRDTLVTVVTEARAPYTNNESLYQLLGPSTFVPGDDEPEQDEVPVYIGKNDKHPDKQPVYEPVNEPIEPTGKVIQGPFINTSVNDGSHAQITERAPVNGEIRKHIRRMSEMGYPHRDISKIVGLYGAKYHIYKQVCAEEGIKIEKEA